MSLAIWVIIITFVAGVCGTATGGFIGLLFKEDSDITVGLLLSFAGGIMLSIVCLDLLSEAMNLASPVTVVLGTLSGYLVIFLINSIIDRAVNRNAFTKKKSSYKLFIGGMVMASAIALHNFPEGMVIGASYANVAITEIFRISELATAIVIGLHNIPEGVAVAVPLVNGGIKKSRAFAITALSGAPTVIGALAGLFLGNISPLWLSLSLSFASGAMLYVVFSEMLPNSILKSGSKLSPFAAIIGILTGVLIVY
ncbi:MAG: ZIP family metal transporter [Clostridia bacterium]|nr:ZIP family metal transporter [Clostridia bacterium]